MRDTHGLTTRLITGLGVLVGVASVVTAVVLEHENLSTPALLGVTITLCLLPVAVSVAAVQPAGTRRDAGRIVGQTGVLLIVGGIALTGSQNAVQHLREDFSPDQMVTNAATVLAPVALAGLGVVVLLGGLALVTGSRVATAAAVVSGVLLDGVQALLLGAASLDGLQYHGGSAHRPLVVAGCLVALAAVLLPVTVLGRSFPRWTFRRPAELLPPGRTVVVGGLGILLAVAVLVSRVVAGSATKVTVRATFPDPALSECVSGVLRPGQELSEVYDLTCDAAGIRSLEGLDALTGLQRLKLTGNQIDDLTPLAGLPRLRELGLSQNRIADLTPLSGLTNLYAVGLADNRVVDPGPLAGHAMLSELDLAHNRIGDLTSMTGLTGLTELTLTDNAIEDVSVLAGSPTLSMLNIAGNELDDTDGLAELAAVDELWLGGNPVTDLSGLRRMPALLGVDLEGCDPATLTGVDELRDAGVYVGGLA